jgi:protein TonB
LEKGRILAYQNAIRQHLARYVFYPEDAGKVRPRGIVTVHVELERGGQVRDVWIESSSGSDALDAAALVAIQRATPMPEIPMGLPDRLELSLPLDFSSVTTIASMRGRIGVGE